MSEVVLLNFVCYNRIEANILMGEECDNQASQGLYPVLEYVIDGQSVKERIDEGYVQLEEVVSYLEENNVTVLDEAFSFFLSKIR